MEKELGVKLFEKNGHKITLTQFGEEFLSYAEKTLDVLDDGIASIKRSAMGNGTIRLGLVRPLGISYVPRMAAAFIKKNPKLDIDFTFHTDVTGRLLDDMQLGKYDLLFCSKPSEEYHFTADPHINNWQHCNAVIIFNNKTSENHVVRIEIEEEDRDKQFTILGFGYVL